MTAPDYPTEPCGSCDAPIIRAVHVRTLKPSVIDAEPSTGGTIALSPGRPPTYRILNTAEQFARTDLRKSHFATCPNAAAHRTGRRR